MKLTQLIKKVISQMLEKRRKNKFNIKYYFDNFKLNKKTIEMKNNLGL